LQVAKTFNDVEDMQSDIEKDDDSILRDFNGVPDSSGADKPRTMLTFVMMLAAVAAIVS